MNQIVVNMKNWHCQECNLVYCMPDWIASPDCPECNAAALRRLRSEVISLERTVSGLRGSLRRARKNGAR